MWVAGYGSLMNKRQFAGKNHRLVMVMGWKRLFNKVALRREWARHAEGNRIAALNIEKESRARFNAVAFWVDGEEKESLMHRERFYDVQEVEISDFSSGGKVGKAAAFVSREADSSGNRIIRTDIMPIPEYLRVSREGAYSWGEVFGSVFDKTTFLADGKTSIEEFLRLGSFL